MSKRVIVLLGVITMIVTAAIQIYLLAVVAPPYKQPTREERLAKLSERGPYRDFSDDVYNNYQGGGDSFHQQQQNQVAFGGMGRGGSIGRGVGGTSSSSSSRIATQMQATTRCATGNWSKVRADLIETVVPQLDIVIVDQSETEAANQDLKPEQKDYVSRYRTFSGEYRFNIPMGESLNTFTHMIKSGRFGYVPFTIRINKRMVEAPMKDLNVEIKLAEADVERVRKLEEWSAKLEEKLRLNTMLRDALRELEYLKSQQRKMTTKVEYADVTFRLRETAPTELPDFVKPLPVWLLVSLLGCFFFFLLGVVAAFNPKRFTRW